MGGFSSFRTLFPRLEVPPGQPFVPPFLLPPPPPPAPFSPPAPGGADYTAYDRDGLEELGLGGYVDAVLSAQSKTWEELSDDVREAASKFCFFEEVWNHETLGTW